jgi:hypothetical protein
MWRGFGLPLIDSLMTLKHYQLLGQLDHYKNGDTPQTSIRLG